ncbi:hypothetical protein F4821DRAFT_189097 [Hypoxylon rubiginosum]|uniref:Uncharacterized protein n=1 Tax=Hypoxylon rubiginosum TaxID=110542 RepID=A0ACC0DFM2_9PEZI|nr:hypothetical protein F4821DRAFT_189097 [Hypoxylon rubiginosum]
MAPTVVSVVYPKGAKFDMDYYLNHHMPLVREKWESYGLKSWKVAQYTNPESPYSVIAWLEFESAEHWAKAAASLEGKDTFADIPHFTDGKADVLVGDVKKSDSW